MNAEVYDALCVIVGRALIRGGDKDLERMAKTLYYLWGQVERVGLNAETDFTDSVLEEAKKILIGGGK